MMETLFCYNTTPVDKSKGQQKKETSSPAASPQYIQIIDSKKSQNLSILLKALNVTIEEVSEALLEGDYFVTSIFLIELFIAIILILDSSRKSLRQIFKIDASFPFGS